MADVRIAIFGTGLIGGQVAALLTASGHEVVPVNRRSGVDTTTGAGVAEALVAVDVVLDATNPRVWSDDEVLAFFESSTATLLTAERAAGVRHHVTISVVGADRVPDSGYFRAKRLQEQMVSGGGIPHTIVRSTQFFEFLSEIADAASVDGVVRMTPALAQPIASSDVAAKIAEVLLDDPREDGLQIAGPDRLPLDEFVRHLLSATGDRRRLESDPAARYFGARLTTESLTPEGDAWMGPTSFYAWLRGAYRWLDSESPKAAV
ncbi:MAG TPA: SDR family oxidoreductase [Actinomycetes bacterium]|nr:SDR family oxidoreductase [Actinomycetes bacterium]